MGAIIGDELQRKTFNERLTRIERGGENTTRHLYVGPVEEAVNGGRRSGRKTRRAAAVLVRPRRSILGELVMVPVALALGGAAVVAARVAGFHLLTEQPIYAANVWYGDLAMASVLALLLRWALKLTGGVRGKAFLAGFAVMLFFEALFVVRAPEVFAVLYSPDHVAEVIAKIGPA